MLMMLELGGSSLKNCKEQVQQNVFSGWVACIHLKQNLVQLMLMMLVLVARRRIFAKDKRS